MPKSAPKPGPDAAHAVLEGGVAETVVGRALVRVFEDLVGFVDFLEAVLGFLVAGIAIGMADHGLLAEGGLDVAVARGAFDRESFVVAALGHQSSPQEPRRTDRRTDG